MRTTELIRLTARLACLTSLLTLGGCAPAMLKAPPSVRSEVADASPETIRTLGADQQFSELPVASVARRVRELRAAEPFTLLALSGGGADGAFGAGALVGLARSGTRPRFSVVTGVSAGALIAPYAFLGAEWDEQLTDAYTGGRAEHLLQPRGLGVIFGSSAYSGSPLENLVDHYLTDALMNALAREAASGRLLLAATTNVDTGETVIWDLGSIAMHGGVRAKELFREVLVASASVPGMFPPVIIRVREHGATYEEAHVDGTATVPFLVPSAFAQLPADQRHSTSPTAVYVIVDGRLSEEPLAVRLRFRSIVYRSISTGLTHMVRTNLELTATTTQLSGGGFEYSAIPVAFPNVAPFDFRASTMRPLFDYGYECARAGRLWISTAPATETALGNDQQRGGAMSSHQVQCPADDDFIGRFAVR
jgi:predicted acylesterase/phospholipase RssA